MSVEIAFEMFLNGFAARHPVSEQFLEAMAPSLRAIFVEAPLAQRTTLLAMAEQCFEHQSQTERLLSSASAELAQLVLLNRADGIGIAPLDELPLIAQGIAVDDALTLPTSRRHEVVHAPQHCQEVAPAYAEAV